MFGVWARHSRGAPLLALVGSAAILVACDPSPTRPVPSATATAESTYDPNWEATRQRPRRVKQVDAVAPERRAVEARPVEPVEPSPDDPLRGEWSLDQALVGLGPGRRLVATIATDVGELHCTLWPERAPIAVANFVGLARGLRPWRAPSGQWRKQPAYDGSQFSRIVPTVLAQGGSPDGERDTGPGYVIADEIWQGANHDRPGLLCLASLRRNQGGMQFAITLGPAYHLDGSFPIFGECGPASVLERLGAVATERARPLQPLRIASVRIGREP